MHRLAATAALFAAGLAATLAPRAATAQIVTAAPTYFEANDKLTAAEMKATFAGKYHEDGVDADGHYWTVDASPDGALKVAAGTFSDTGQARLDGEKLCVSYSKAWKGVERCYRYAHHGKELASYGPDGKLDSVITISR
jgi:hypothetical protein